MSSVLEVKDLRTEFHMRTSNVVAVDGVTFRVGKGECVGIVGESGCGKSTTGFSIMRLLPGNGHLSGGAITLNGRDLADLSEKEMRRVRGNEVALIPQDPLTSLNPTTSIGRQISEAVLLHRDVTHKEARARAVEVLTMVEMPRPAERLDQYPHELSGGLRQRVMIAMALACEPSLLIADEPTTALDVTIQAQILDLIDGLRERLHMAVILITHDMGVIAGRTDRVVVMYAGKVVEEAATPELFDRMRHPYTEALLASVPKLDQRASDRLLSIPGLPPDLSLPHLNCRFHPRCLYATDECRAAEPPLTADESSPEIHRFACFHPVQHGEKVAVTIRSVEDPIGEARAADLATRPPLLEVDRLVKEFPVLSGAVFRHEVGKVHAVSDISFGVRQGETYGLVGESGCGKTTVGRLVVGLESTGSGSIKFDGVELADLGGRELRRYRRNLQLMFQDPYASLDPRMKVGAILREPLVVQRIGTRAERDKVVAELLDKVGLPRSAISRYPHEFSGGQRQRIGFARALILNPRLIVADEPVSALDVSIQSQVINLMKDLQDSFGLTYVVISHDLSVVKYLADRIGIMYLGKLVEVGPSEVIYDHPAHPYTEALLTAIPIPDPVKERAKPPGFIKGELPSSLNPPSGCRFRTRCPRAQEICAVEEPLPQSFGPDHAAACHFPLDSALTAASGVVRSS
jgi:peptide/nickel transport system ATP-binding protein